MIVLDTNVISELMRVTPADPVLAWMALQQPDDLFTSSINVAEILYGIELLPKGKRRDALLHEADITFARTFAGRILSFDERAARAFSVLVADRRLRGSPIQIADGQIVAIAKANDATLATRNVGDFEGCGVKLVNPWEG